MSSAHTWSLKIRVLDHKMRGKFHSHAGQTDGLTEEGGWDAVWCENKRCDGWVLTDAAPPSTVPLVRCGCGSPA